MSFIHIPKSQVAQMFRANRTDWGVESCCGFTDDNQSFTGVPYISNNGSGGVWPWQNHNSFIHQINTASGYAGLRLYKGVMPTYSEIAAFANFETTGNNAAVVDYSGTIRTSDHLVKLGIGASSGAISDGKLVVNLTAGVATQSGTASWFCFRTQSVNNQSSMGVKQAYAIFGTVGLEGSGADLEVTTTTITSSQTIRIMQVKLPLPLHLTW